MATDLRFDLLALPPELLALVVKHLVDDADGQRRFFNHLNARATSIWSVYGVIMPHARPQCRDLCSAAAACKVLAAASDEVARAACHARGLPRKGLWCAKLSWRAMLHGRTYRAGMRIRKQLTAAGSSRTRARAASKPVAIAALPGGRAAVCCQHTRQVALLDLVSGVTLRTLRVDGLPCGICTLGPERPHSVAVTVQGAAESGAALPGVHNAADRIEFFYLGDEPPDEHDDRQVPRALRRWDGQTYHTWSDEVTSAIEIAYREHLSNSSASWPLFEVPPERLHYPNGLALVPDEWVSNRTARGNFYYPKPPVEPFFAVANWNAEEVSFLSSPSNRDAIRLNCGFPQTSESKPTPYNRPSDVAFLHDGSSMVVSDFYGGCVWLHCTMWFFGDGTGQLFDVEPVRVLPSRGRRSMARPSGLAVDPSSGCLLVAEAGAMCISVFAGTVQWAHQPSGPPPGSPPEELDDELWPQWCAAAMRHEGHRPPFLLHLCDICIEQLGTGLHKPLSGEWSWLGVSVSEEGDVIVADCDRDAVYLV